MRTLWILFIAFVLTIILAVAGGEDVQADCGRTVSTPFVVKVIDSSQDLGRFLKNPEGEGNLPKTLVGFSWRVLMGMNGIWDAVNRAYYGEDESAWATGIRTRVSEKQAAALAACCVAFPPQKQPPSTPDAPKSNPWNPKNASFQNSDGNGFTTKQKEYAAQIISVRKNMGLPPRADIVAFATVMQESKFKMYANRRVPASLNIPHDAVGDDHDSVGLFQQRPDWGPLEDLMDPAPSARLFFNALQKVRGWESKPVTVAAQAVQISGFPNAYAQWEDEAEALAASIAPSVPDSGTLPGTQVQPLTPPNDSDFGAGTQFTPPAGCPLPNLGGAVDAVAAQGDGNVEGEITLVAELDPKGSGNWQGAVKQGNFWYVAHATAGDRSAIFHRLNSKGAELDQMEVVGAKHPTGFGVVGKNVYATFGVDIMTFPYQPGKKITRAQAKDTGWNGEIAIDPNRSTVVIRNGNRYSSYDLNSKVQQGIQVVTPRGPRQGFSVNNGILYVLSGHTNKEAWVETYSFSTGKKLGTRDLTKVGLKRGEKTNFREPEGMYGSMAGIKVHTGEKRRLRIYNIASGKIGYGAEFALSQKPVGPRGNSGLTPRGQYGRDITMKKWGCASTKSNACIRSIGGYVHKKIAGSNQLSDHATGNAIDIMVDARTNKALGDEIAAYFQTNRDALAVKYIIWNAQIWSPERDSEGWRHYSTPRGGSDHKDHVHVSFKSGQPA